MLPELLLQLLTHGASDDSPRESTSSTENEQNTAEGDVSIYDEVTDVFNNPSLLAVIAAFLPDPPLLPPPRPDNAVRRSPRLEQARGPPVYYREWTTSRGHVFSFPLYAPVHPLDNAFDTIYVIDTDDEEDDENFVDDTEYLEYLDRGGDPRLFQRERERD